MTFSFILWPTKFNQGSLRDHCRIMGLSLIVPVKKMIASSTESINSQYFGQHEWNKMRPSIICYWLIGSVLWTQWEQPWLLQDHDYDGFVKPDCFPQFFILTWLSDSCCPFSVMFPRPYRNGINNPFKVDHLSVIILIAKNIHVPIQSLWFTAKQTSLTKVKSSICVDE